MNTAPFRFPSFVLAVVALLVVAVAPLLAAGGPPPWAGQGKGPGPSQAMAPASGDDELVALDRFLSMSDEELDALQRAIARVRAMSPKERAALREQMLAYRLLPAEQREQVRAGWGWQSDEDRRDWQVMMRSKSADEKAAIQSELQALPPEQRAARKHTLLEAWRAETKATP